VLTASEGMDRVMVIIAVRRESSQFVARYKKGRKNGWGKGGLKGEIPRNMNLF
jgi:hypothetical protein